MWLCYEEGVETVKNGMGQDGHRAKSYCCLVCPLLGDDLAALWGKYSQWALERVKSATQSMELHAVVCVVEVGRVMLR